MKQTRADTGIAIVQAVLLHVLLFLLLFAGLRWSQQTTVLAAPGEPIEADLVTADELGADLQRALGRSPTPPPQKQAPLPKPLPEPAPAPSAPHKALPPPVPEPAPVEQEKVQRDAPSPEVAKRPREQEARQRQPDQTELNAQRQAELERQRLRQIEELRRLREQAARERIQAEMRAQQLAEARMPAATPPPGNRGSDDDLQARYAAALQQAIARQWTRPETVPLGQRCRLTIHQIPGGEVISVDIAPSCPYDALGRRSVEAAVLKASPLPYAGYERVFSRVLELNFVAEDR